MCTSCFGVVITVDIAQSKYLQVRATRSNRSLTFFLDLFPVLRKPMAFGMI